MEFPRSISTTPDSADGLMQSGQDVLWTMELKLHNIEGSAPVLVRRKVSLPTPSVLLTASDTSIGARKVKEKPAVRSHSSSSLNNMATGDGFLQPLALPEGEIECLLRTGPFAVTRMACSWEGGERGKEGERERERERGEREREREIGRERERERER